METDGLCLPLLTRTNAGTRGLAPLTAHLEPRHVLQPPQRAGTRGEEARDDQIQICGCCSSQNISSVSIFGAYKQPETMLEYLRGAAKTSTAAGASNCAHMRRRAAATGPDPNLLAVINSADNFLLQ